ncbi:type II toxin-antitoxin system RelE/ParE family toxin [Cohnella sp.]|uniref:type II toxin-antitoxin system RelE/ParE family toxin n=1 Tax=Cohnella sp. TaxID=1883426 RepID=UPI00356B4DAF
MQKSVLLGCDEFLFYDLYVIIYARIQLEQIIYCLNRLEDKGTRAGEKFTKRIKGEIWELRPGNNRIFFFGWKGNQLVLLHHFSKTSQKTPSKEIAIAEKRMVTWLRNMQKE